jgi:hypothetical protein
MSLVLILALQAALPASSPAPIVAPIDFDLGRYRSGEPGLALPGRDCSGGGAAIVVCGRRRSGGAFPMEEMERLFAQGPLVAETGLTGAMRGRAYVERVEFPGGQVSNRVMVGIKLPF